MPSIHDIINGIKEALMDFWYWCVNGLIALVASIIDLASSLLPTWSPLTVGEPSEMAVYMLQCLNWIFPTSYAITLLSLIGSSVVLYFSVGTITRWAKVTN